ncbi:hypothetical protein Sjap_005198 [Stephania japonica]|uniref:Uncharacterized protein n=1 Tax=Stephania japonica TaxID=461633 RepID=A0AAP0K4M9_9MAGN
MRKCWLQSTLCPKVKPSTFLKVACTARAYLLYLLSCTLFADKGRSRVSITLL